MRLPTSRQCAPMEGDGGQKTEHAPPLRNPFVHLLRFTPLEKAKVNASLMDANARSSAASAGGGGGGGGGGAAGGGGPVSMRGGGVVESLVHLLGSPTSG